MSNKTVFMIVLIVSVILIMEENMKEVSAVPYRYSQYQEKIRNKLKPKGFKSAKLSTARGFGKRFETVPMNAIRDGFPVEWLVEKMQVNPDLTKALVEIFIDSNEDGRISEDELGYPKFCSQKCLDY